MKRKTDTHKNEAKPVGDLKKKKKNKTSNPF